MEFCPNCSAMLLPQGKTLKCQCGYTQDLSDSKQYELSEKIENKDTVIVKEEDINTLPTTNATCPKCGHGKAAWWLQQTRSADEAETRFLRCLSCKNTWREYD